MGARKPSYSVFLVTWLILVLSRPSWLYQGPKLPKQFWVESSETALRRVLSRIEFSLCAFRGALRGSSPVVLSNGPVRSLSYTWRRFQRLQKLPCTNTRHECWGFIRTFHELLRFPSVFSMSGLRSSAGVGKRLLHSISRGHPSPHYAARRFVPEEPNHRVSHPSRALLSATC